jgi:hypothetical protein
MLVFATVNPTTGAVVRQFESLTDEGVTAALKATGQACRSWWHRARTGSLSYDYSVNDDRTLIHAATGCRPGVSLEHYM